MFNLNEVKLGGNLVAAPELKTTANGNPVLSFTLAVNRKVKDQTVPTFIECVAWRNVATAMANNLGKGATIYVNGHIDVQNWTNKEGQKRSKTIVVADAVQFIVTKKVKDPTPAAVQDEAPEADPDDELPF